MFSEKLIELRKKNKDTQESLAKQLHVSRSLIAKWEQGRAYPNMEYVEKIAELYNVTINEVVDNKELRNEFDKTVTKNKILKLSLFSILSLMIILGFLIPFFVTNEKYSEYYTEVVIIDFEEAQDGYVWYLDKNSFVDTPIVKSEITYYFEQDSIIDGINFFIEGMIFERGIEYYNLNVPIDLSKFDKVTLTYQVYTKRDGYGFIEGQGYSLSKVNFNIE